MTPKKDSRTPQAWPPQAAALALGFSWVLVAASMGQSADVFNPGKLTEKRDSTAAKAEPKEPEPVDTKPSRFAGQDIDPYVASRAAVFSMRNRDTDPFGLNQDPNVKPVIRKMASSSPIKRQAALPPTPLADIVKLIRVTTIMPGEKKFLVGIRPFSESDEFPLVFRGKTMRMKVMEVSAQRIVFRNLDNEETAPLETGMLPPGMVAGAGTMPPPGMVSPTDNIPLELGSPESPEANN